MLAERSSRMSTVSGAEESAHPAQPPASGPRHRQDEGQQRQHAAGEQQDLAEPGVPRGGAVRGEEKARRGPVNGAEAHAVQQMDDDRQRGQRQQPEERGLEESHRRRRRRVRCLHGRVESLPVLRRPDEICQRQRSSKSSEAFPARAAR